MVLNKQDIENVINKNGGKKNRFKHIEITVAGDKYEYLLKKPNRNVIEALATAGQSKDIAKANAILLKNCVVLGDMDVIDEDSAVYEKVLTEIQTLTSNATVAVKKL